MTRRDYLFLPGSERMRAWLMSVAVTGTFGCDSDYAPTDRSSAGASEGLTDEQGCHDTDLRERLESGRWDGRFTLAGVTGPDGLTPKVFDFAMTPDGSILASGYFSWLGQSRVEPLIRHRSGIWDAARGAWELEPPAAGFSAVAVGEDGTIALATNDPLEPHTSEVWVDRGSGLEVVGTMEGAVRSLAWYGDRLWVAGIYSHPAGSNLLVWSEAGWTLPPGGAADGAVYGLDLDGADLFVSGAFASVGGLPADKIAAWNGTAWSAYDLGFFGQAVYAVERGPEGTLYAGGAFSGASASGTTTGGIAHWIGREWELLAGGVANAFFPGTVTDIEFHDGDLYITGCFAAAGGIVDEPGSIRAESLARWTGSQWESLDEVGSAGSPWFEMAACGDEGPFAVWDVRYQRLASDGMRLFLGGSFGGVDGVASQSLIAWEGDRWAAQGTQGIGMSGPVDDLAVAGRSVYAFGSGITHAGGEPLPSRVARFDGDGWIPVGGPLPPDLQCFDFAVAGRGAAPPDVYLGCVDSTFSAAHILRLEGAAWREVGEPHGLAPLHDLAVDPAGRLWVAGGSEGGYVARLDGDSFTVVENGFDAPVLAIDFAPGPANPRRTPFLVAGVFSQIGDAPFSRVALFDDGAWTPLGDGLPATPSAIEFGTHAVYAATFDEGAPDRLILGRWDGQTWTELATPERGLPPPFGQSSHTFTALLEVDSALIATGYVWPETGGRNIFLYESDRFTAIGGGAGAISVDAVVRSKNSLWFGGSIAEVGLTETPLPSVGVARFTWSRAH